jgi:hypothetical protein
LMLKRGEPLFYVHFEGPTRRPRYA